MPGWCCRGGGFVHPDKAATLQALENAGVFMPDGAQLHGPRDGIVWRLVDIRGHDPTTGPVYSRHTIRQCTTGVDTIPDGHGGLLVVPKGAAL